MKLSVSGKQIDVGEALREHVAAALDGAVGKYFDAAIDGTVLFSRQAHLFCCDIQVHARRGIFMQAEAEADDIHVAFDRALDRIAKRLRRYKRRLRDHHQSNGSDEIASASQYVLADTGAEGGDEAQFEEPGRLDPVVVAEMQTKLLTLTVGEAVMHLDLIGQPAMMFRNSAHGGLNMVYRRNDGNIAWVDPQNLKSDLDRASSGARNKALNG
jgi:ribosomal subunit interface protein